MGMLDKFLDVMRLNSDDDDFYDDDYYDDDYEEEKPKRRSSTKEKNSEAEEESYEEKRPRPVKSQKVTPMRPSKRQNVSGMEVCVIKPTTVDDAREITETLLLDRTVVLNVEGLDVDIAQRIIDLPQALALQSAETFKRFLITYLLLHRQVWIFLGILPQILWIPLMFLPLRNFEEDNYGKG